MYRKLSQSQKGKFLPFLLKNWWVGTVIVMTFALYAEALYQKRQVATRLEGTRASLMREKKRALEEREILTLRLISEEDPEWIELALKQKLGVVPEGETKIVFKE